MKNYILGNMACFAFLGASLYFVHINHIFFGIASFIVAVTAGVKPKTDD